MDDYRNKRKNGKNGMFSIEKSRNFHIDPEERAKFNSQFDAEQLIGGIEEELKEHLQEYGIDFDDLQQINLPAGVGLWGYIEDLSKSDGMIHLRFAGVCMRTISSINEYLKDGNHERAVIYALRLANQFQMFTVARFENEICAGRLRYDPVVKEKQENKEKRKQEILSQLPEVVSEVRNKRGKVTKAEIYRHFIRKHGLSETTIKRYLQGVDIKTY